MSSTISKTITETDNIQTARRTTSAIQPQEYAMSLNSPEVGAAEADIVKQANELAQKELLQQFKQDIINVISNDFFEDGVVSNSERYILEVYSDDNASILKQAIMDLYLEHYDNGEMLTGLLIMVASLPYVDAKPQGPIIALGVLQHRENALRDRAIRAFERWNSKEGISILKALRCDVGWLQRYVDKVIQYLERDGI